MQARAATAPALPRGRIAQCDGGPVFFPAGAPETLVGALRDAAAAPMPNEIVYVQLDGTEVRQTHADLLERARRACRGLISHGLRPGDKALLQIEAGPEFVALFWGCVLAGIVPVPMSVSAASDDTDAAIRKLHTSWQVLGRPKVLATGSSVPTLRNSFPADDAFASDLVSIDGWFDEAAPDPAFEPAPDAVAVLLLTSGSSGVPKAVPLSHRNVLAYAYGAAQSNGFTRADVSLNWLPLDHVGGLVMFHVRDVVMRCTHIHVPTEMILRSPLRWMDLVDHYRATLTWAPNFAFALVNQQAPAMAGRAWDLTCLRCILNGGEMIMGATARRFLELLAPFGLPETAMVPIWGMSETSSGVTFSHRFRRETGLDVDTPVEVGAPIPGVALRIVDTQNLLLAEGETGKVQVRGSPVTAGYLDAQGIDRSAFTPDGWLRTGDLGMLQDGQLTITGRAKDVIIVNGVKFSCHEIEAVVETVSGVEMSFTAACAVRQPGDQTDQLALFLVTPLTRGGEQRDLVDRIRFALADHAQIVAQHVVLLEGEQIPKTSIGKIRRAELKRRFKEGEFTREECLPAASTVRLAAAFHQRVWRESSRPAPQSLPEGPWLVFADSLGLGAAFVRDIQSQGGHCILVTSGDAFRRLEPDRFVVDPLQPPDYARLHATLDDEGLVPRHTLHMWAYGPERLGTMDFARAQALVSHSVLFGVQALARSRASKGTHHLWVISSRACEVRRGDGVACEKAALGGLVKTLPLECAWLSCTHVDLAGIDVGRDLEDLCGEVAAGDEHREVAYRDGRRWLAQLEEVEVPAVGSSPVVASNSPVVAATPPVVASRSPVVTSKSSVVATNTSVVATASPVVASGCYLVSGGLGGIGSLLVESLLEQYQAHVLVIGRSPLDSAMERMRELRRFGGDLTYVSADIADAAAVEAAIRDAERGWGRALDGIFHLAGTYVARPLLDETPETLAHGLHAKVTGAWVLHQSLQQRRGTFIVYFSSVLGAFGGAFAGVYAAGNAFLAGLSHQQRALGWRSHCLMWSQWEDTGMNRGTGLDSALRGKGYRSLTRAQGLELLWAALRADQPHVLIGLDEKNLHIRSHLAAPPEEFAAAVLTSIAPRTVTERELARIWRDLLGVEDISVHANFFEIGGDSLMAVRVVAEIESTFGRSLPMTELFRSPTLEQLAAVVDHEATRPGSCALVPLRAAGTGAPFFCVAGAGEDASIFTGLVAALPVGRPIYGLHVRGLDATDPDTPHRSVEGVGAQLLDVILSIQPHGPYSLGGHCLGGLFAYEAAQQLRAENEQVALLVLIDTIVSDSLPIYVVAPLRVRLGEHWRKLSSRSAWGKVQYVARELAGREAAMRLRRQLHRALAPIEEMHRRYVLKPYPGRLTLVFASDSFLNRDPARDPRRSWERLALDGADILTVAGDHESLLHPPFVDDLGRQLGLRLQSEQPAGTKMAMR